MFVCPKCKARMDLPRCSCGYAVPCKNDIWQLSDMPDIITQGEGDKYIGYEFIGESYSGSRKYIIEKADRFVAQEISRETGNGVFFGFSLRRRMSHRSVRFVWYKNNRRRYIKHHAFDFAEESRV